MRPAWLLLLGAAACIDAGRPAGDGASNARPRAVAEPGGEFRAGTTVTLDGSASFDPDGGALRYSWRRVEAPAGAGPFSDTGRADAELHLAVAGTYRVTLRVTDDRADSDESTVVLIATGPQITVDLGADRTVRIGEPVALTGSAVSEDDAPLTHAWTVVDRPSGSNAIVSSASPLEASLVPDVAGPYTIRLTSTATVGSVGHDEVVIRATHDQRVLDHEPIELEYASALDRLVTISANPPRLNLIDPATGAQQAIVLSAAPTAVAFEPGQLRAAVGHDGAISIVDLVAGDVTQVVAVSSDVDDLMFDGAGRVHALPATQQFGQFLSVDLATGEQNFSTGGHITNDNRGWLHPVRTTVAYAVNPTGWVQRFDLTPASAVAERLYLHSSQSPLVACHEQWFTADGASLINSCGVLLASSADPEQDLRQVRHLTFRYLVWADHAPALGRVVTLEIDPSTDEAFVVEYTDDSFLGVRFSAMPTALVGDAFVPSSPLFVAHRADGSERYLVTVAGGATVLFRMAP
jgi:hypothetical protein